MILLNIKKIINEYVECNVFEIKFINNKVIIYYYDKIKHFSNDKIIVIKDEQEYIVEGKHMVIETLFKEEIIISGKINNIYVGKNNG